jgi:3-hydroxyacyl-[acyl-carrier-protein] dehydratase
VGKELIVDLNSINVNQVVADIQEIRKYNAQRYEMEQVTAIVYENVEELTCVGYKDVTHEEFWVRGHMPGMPLMPGVIMLEAVAQLCSYFVQKFDLLGAAMVGFGGLEEVRFRDPVIPGDRLFLLAKMLKARRGRMLISAFQGVVNGSLVVDGVLKGIPIPVDALQQHSESS